MEKYEYQAINSKGKKVSGFIEQENIKAARAQLRKQGVMPTSIEEAGKFIHSTRSMFGFISLKSKVKSIDLMVLTRQLATLVSAGNPLVESLSLIGRQSENKRLAKAVTLIKGLLTEGYSLSYALANNTLIFPVSYIATVAAGEESGKLPQVLLRLADDVEKSAQTKQTVGGALVYPVIMVVVAISVVVLLMTFVVPKITEVYASQNQQLPILTTVMISVSETLRAHGIYILWCILISIITFVYVYRRPSFKYRVHRLLVKSPVLGHWIIIANVSRWSRSLSILLSSGVPSLQSIQLASDSISNLYLHDKMLQVTKNVREGASLFRSLQQHSEFPNFLTYLINSGEQSGNLDEMLMRTADYYERTLRQTTEAAVKLFEPLLILVMGSVVMVIVMAILLPLFGINQLIK